MVSDEQFFAWLDGELDGEQAAQVAAAVEADPELARRAERHRALQSKLRASFGPVADAPVPRPLMTAARRGETEVVDFAAAPRSREPRKWASLPPWAALAATLAIGILAGTLVPKQGNAPIAVEGANIYAAATLDRALDTQLASAPSGKVRIGMTFRDHSGATCRTFTDAAASGLACRSGERWQLRGLFAAPEGQSGDYRMAGGMEPGLASLVGTSIAGEPFDAAQERAAKDRGWR